METSKTWIDAAVQLSGIPIDVRDGEFQAEVVSGLDGMIHLLDEATAISDLDDADLGFISGIYDLQARILQVRFHLLGHLSDLERCIHLLETLPQLCPTDAQRLQSISEALTECLTIRNRIHNPGYDVRDQAAELLHKLDLPPDFVISSNMTIERLGGLSEAPLQFHNYSRESHDVMEVERVITALDLGLECFAPDNQDLEPLCGLIGILGAALLVRFKLLGVTTDLDRSVYSLEIATHFCHPISAPYVLSTLALISALGFRYNRIKYPRDLDRSIELGEEFLSMPRGIGGQTQALASYKLAQVLSLRSSAKGITADSIRVIQMCKVALPFAEGKLRSDWLELRVEALKQLSRLRSPVSDLEEALGFFYEAYGDVDSTSNDPEGPFHQVAFFLWTQLKVAAIAGDGRLASRVLDEIHARGYPHWEDAFSIVSSDTSADTDCAIEVLEQRCSSSSSHGDTVKPFAVILILSLCQRYNTLQNPRDLREAVSLRSLLGPPGTYGRGLDAILYGFAAAEDYNGSEMSHQCVEALAAPSQRGPPLHLQPVPRGGNTIESRDQGFHASGEALLNQMRQMQGWYFSRMLHARERDSSIPTDKISQPFESPYPQGIRPEDIFDLPTWLDEHNQHPEAYQTLSEVHADQYRQRGDLENLHQAVDYSQKAMDSIQDDDETPLAWRIRSAWAEQIFTLDEITDSVEPSRVLLAHDHLRKAALSTFSVPKTRLQCTKRWFTKLPRFWEEHKRSVPDMCNLAMSLLEEQSWTASSPRSSVNLRYDLKSLSSAITYSSLLYGIETGNPVECIELLEATQALMWGQFLRLRAPLSELAPFSPELASRFQSVSATLERRLGLSSGGPHARADPLGTHDWQLHHDRDQIIQEIRKLPGFDDLLKRRTLGDLHQVGYEGPVVVLSPFDHVSVALVFYKQSLKVFTIPFTRTALENLHKSLKWLADARGESMGRYGPLAGDIHTAGPSESASGSRGGRPRFRGSTVEDVLEILWKRVVDPVFDELFQMMDEKGKSKTNIPVSSFHYFQHLISEISTISPAN